MFTVIDGGKDKHNRKGAGKSEQSWIKHGYLRDCVGGQLGA